MTNAAYTVAPDDGRKPEFSALSDDERAWVANHLEGAGQFVAAMSPADGDGRVTPEALDRAFAAWLAQPSGDDNELNAGINVVGVQFGQFLVDQAGFEWTIATDGQGTGLAVRALPGRGDVLVYPQSFIAKRWERRETGTLVSLLHSIREHVASVAAGWDAAPRRPRWKLWS